MSRATATIRGVAPPRKGHNTRRSLRLTDELNDDFVILADLHHRSANDEMVNALERYRDEHAAELKEQKKRRS